MTHLIGPVFSVNTATNELHPRTTNLPGKYLFKANEVDLVVLKI